jgi:hypothetical protein
MAGVPLRRTSDRVERAGRRACVALAWLGIPLAIAVAWFSHQAATVAVDHYAATVFDARATTLEDAPDRLPPGAREMPAVAARWVGADRVTHRGDVRVPVGSEAGYELPVWTSASTGELAEGPTSRRQLVVEAVLLAVKVMLATALIAFASFRLLRHGLNRWRYREWDRAWETFGTGRSPG